MASYKIEWKQSAIKELKKLQKKTISKIIQTIETLPDNLHPPGSRKLHGKPFPIYKFRTMTNERDGNENLLPDGKRLTRLGRFLRKTSMDDPQITQISAD